MLMWVQAVQRNYTTGPLMGLAEYSTAIINKVKKLGFSRLEGFKGRRLIKGCPLFA
jgi:hypothetical protein